MSLSVIGISRTIDGGSESLLTEKSLIEFFMEKLSTNALKSNNNKHRIVSEYFQPVRCS